MPDEGSDKNVPNIEVTRALAGWRRQDQRHGDGIEVGVPGDGSRTAVPAFSKRVGDLALEALSHSLLEMVLTSAVRRSAIKQDRTDAHTSPPVGINTRT